MEYLELFAKFYLITGLIISVLCWGLLHLKEFNDFLLEEGEEPWDFKTKLIVTLQCGLLWPSLLYDLGRKMR